MNFLNNIVSLILLLTILHSIRSHPLATTSNHSDFIPSQIDKLCLYFAQLQKHSMDSNKIASGRTDKRFAMPFPDMNRFLSTSHKLHHHGSSWNSVDKQNKIKHDFHSYLCSISKDSEEMSNFLNVFIQEHGQPPAFNIFESCEQVNKRDLLATGAKKSDRFLPYVRLNDLSTICSSRLQLQFTKRWKHTVEGPISIDFIHQMLESRKVKPYPYPAEIDPYVV